MIVLSVVALLFAAFMLRSIWLPKKTRSVRPQIPEAKIWSTANDWSDVEAYEANT
jgi:hypothetical protein